MAKQTKTQADNFIQAFEFVPDKSKPGRLLSTAKIGEIYMSRLIINPGVTTGNYYHKKTRVMFYVADATVLVVFEHVRTKEHKEMTFKPGKQVVHVPPYVSFATKNISKKKITLVFFSNRPLRDVTDNFHYKVM